MFIFQAKTSFTPYFHLTARDVMNFHLTARDVMNFQIIEVLITVTIRISGIWIPESFKWLKIELELFI